MDKGASSQQSNEAAFNVISHDERDSLSAISHPPQVVLEVPTSGVDQPCGSPGNNGSPETGSLYSDEIPR